MSKAGQYNFTGISAQADITLLYLLQAVKRSDFKRMIIEGDSWEDFALIFDDDVEDYEVKWYKRPISYSDIRTIVKKELQKKYKKGDSLKIIVKKLSKSFRQDYVYIKKSLVWWGAFKKRYLKDNPVVKKFVQKNWDEKEIAFLFKTDIKELKDDKYVMNRIMEYFAFEDLFYLGEEDLESIVARSFRRILKEGSKGRSISKQEFFIELNRFKESITKKSESFSKNPIAEKIGNINKFLKSETNFKALDKDKYLSPISASPRLIFYITDHLEKRDFDFGSYEFFLNKILIKQHYVIMAMRLLQNKWRQRKIKPEYILNFIINNYKSLFSDFNYDDALKLIFEIAKEDVRGLHEDKILEFLKKEILTKFEVKKEASYEEPRTSSDFKEIVAELVNLFFRRASDKKVFIDFIFEYYDFTISGVYIDTSKKIFDIVRNYILDDLKNNFSYVVQKICDQFNRIYKGHYKGYELIGGTVGRWGSSYSVEDIGVVRLIFEPLFNNLYSKSKQEAWNLFKDYVLNKAIKRSTNKNPIFLKRSLIGIIIGRIKDKNLNKIQKEESQNYLKNILGMKKGIPGTSEVIFQELRKIDISEFKPKYIMDLIYIDSFKYKTKKYPGGFPTNLFVISTLINLIKLNYNPAKNYFFELIKKPEFIARDQWYNSFELLHQENIVEAEPVFLLKVIEHIGLEKYLNSLDRYTIWDKSDILADLIKKDWKDKAGRGKLIIKKLLSRREPSRRVLEFVAGIIHDLSKRDPLKTYELFEIYLQNKNLFRRKFKSNSHARQEIVWLAEELAKNRQYDKAKKILELCYDDPDPVTNNKPSDFNFHLRVKNGENEHTISTVRGIVGWVLRFFSASNIPELMKYSLGKTELLLDLNGDLAKRLGYSEPDNYVRLLALVSLLELAYVYRRKKLNEFELGSGDEVKKIPFKIIKILEKQIEITNKIPVSILKNLIHVFSHIRDLSTSEAQRVIVFFKKYEIVDVQLLLIFFAAFREDYYKHIPFKSDYFKKELDKICNSENIFRQRIALEFLRIASDKKKDSKKYFKKIEKYWKSLFCIYNKEVFDYLYRTLEVTLTWPNKYEKHKELLKEAIQKETEYLRGLKKHIYSWGLHSEIFNILQKNNTKDFLEIFYLLIMGINENIYHFAMDSWIMLFNSISPKTNVEKNLSEKIKIRLKELYPEKYLNVAKSQKGS